MSDSVIAVLLFFVHSVLAGNNPVEQRSLSELKQALRVNPADVDIYY